MQRFLVPPGGIDDSKVALDGSLAHQIAVVLRLRVGERIVLFDGSGEEAPCLLTAVSPRRVTADVLQRVANRNEMASTVHLFPALIRGPRFELVLQKATELGVAAITPFASRRSIIQEVKPNIPERWWRIVGEATEQSGRARVPLLSAPVSFESACERAITADLSLGCIETGGADLRAVILDRTAPSPRSVAVLVGPEGGFDPSEVEALKVHGVQGISLGPRILRAETASLAICAALALLLGDWARTPSRSGSLTLI